MHFCVGLGRNESVNEIIELAQLAEEVGYDSLTLTDQQNIWYDVYAMLGVLAVKTRTIKLGQGVTVPETRHPTVTANATATLNELSGGRAFLGIGSGGNALRSMYVKLPPQQRWKDTVEFCRAYWTGGWAEYEGARAHSDWIKDQKIPIYMAVAGPRSCRIAAEVADGILLNSLSHPEVAKWRLEIIEKAATKAGRNIADIDIWQNTMIYAASSKEDAVRECRGLYQRSIWELFRNKGEDIDELRRRLTRTIPDMDAFLEEARIAYEAYDEYWHERVDAPHGKLMTQRMIDFQHFTGTPDEVCARIDELRALGVRGIRGTLFTVIDKPAMIRKIGTEIIPRYRN